MPTAPKHYITPEAYLEQERKSEWRSEYLDGEAFPIVGASRNHALMVTNLVCDLSQKLRERPWAVSIMLNSIDMELLLTDICEKARP